MSSTNRQRPELSQRDRLVRFLASLFEGPKALGLTGFALLGIVFGVFLLVDGVSVTVNGTSATCGSVVAPIKDFVGNQATCGGALSEQAIHSSAFFLGGVGYLLYPLVRASSARVLLLVGLACTAASLLGLRNGVEPVLAIIPAAYCSGMTVLVGRKGLSRGDDD